MAQSEVLGRITKILLEGVDRPTNPVSPEGLKCQFVPKFQLEPERRPVKTTDSAPTNPVRDGYIVDVCRRLFDATDDFEDYVERLDSIYTELFTFHLHLQPSQTTVRVSEAVDEFLRRLPDQPLGLPGVSELANIHLDINSNRNGNRRGKKHGKDNISWLSSRRSSLWPGLRVTTYHTTNVLRIILLREVYEQHGTDGIEEKHLVDLTAELLHQCCQLEIESDDQCPRDLDRWLVVRCFLWAAWQRAQMLYFYRILKYQLGQRVVTGLGSLTILRSTLVAPGLTIQQFSDKVATKGKARYMCSWAFNLLRTDAIAVGSDFRLFHRRYNQLFGHYDARCNENSTESCDGSQLGNCRRSRRHVEDQSMHDQACPGDCPKLVWDEQSYLSVTGGRAVDASFDDRTDYTQGLLKYRPVSERTMAITHAWAHGQGGRPSTGLNQCLHIRYVQLAHKHECDGYFLDTACIPEDHNLRKEAIEHINDTFRQSRITLIVDRDLLTVDVVNKSVKLSESLLASVLVSDWNVRAWTLLEALKGRSKIYLLCKDGQCMSYGKLIETVAGRGRIDIAIYVLLAPHLHSWTDNADDEQLSLEAAGTRLSYRPASRPGDDLVIWSLMFTRAGMLPQNAKEFWQNLIGKSVATGFLVSSARRVGVPGLTWAPDSAYAAPTDDTLPLYNKKKTKASERFFRAFSGEESEYATITKDGILAEWCIYEFDTNLLQTMTVKTLRKVGISRSPCDRSSHSRSEVDEALNDARLHYLSRYYRYGALAQPRSSRKAGPWTMHQHIAEYSGGVKGTLVVLLGSDKSESMSHNHRGVHHDDLVKWEWKDVFEWPAGVALPEFENKMIWIS